jgi:hypothetical protein
MSQAIQFAIIPASYGNLTWQEMHLKQVVLDAAVAADSICRQFCAALPAEQQTASHPRSAFV